MEIGAELTRLRQTDEPRHAVERQLIGRLGPLVLGVIDHSDRAAQAGAERQWRAKILPAFEAIHQPLHAIYTARSRELERMARTIMDEDGDLEALYETSQWQQSQEVAARSLYFLNWLSYYGARLYDGARSRELLEAAERGFSEFAIGDHHAELRTESLLGRGLCHLELGHHEWAVRDFRIVIDEPEVSDARKTKARLALLDAYARAGSVESALSYAQSLLDDGTLTRGDAALVRFYRLQALFDAVEKSSGSTADRYRREAGALMDRLRRAGKQWAAKVDALLVTRIDDPALWVGKVRGTKATWELAKMLLQKGDSAGAIPLLEEIASSSRRDAARYRHEARYWLGVSRFKSGDYRGAADDLTAALAVADADYAGEAAYLRFKSLEAVMAEDATRELAERYVSSARDFLTAHADHPHAYEARYRLAEYLQARGELDAAIEEYAKVTGDPGFELRAGFGALQSSFELLKLRREPPARRAVLDAIGPGIERFREQAEIIEARGDPRDVPLKELAAKVSVMQAVYISLRGPGGNREVAALLADYDQRFPEERELLPQAVRLRLRALQQLGEFAAAEQAVAKHAAVLREEGRADALERLAAAYAKAGARRGADGDTNGARTARRVALRLYELLNGGDDRADARRQLTIARLHESTGDLAAAAALYRKALEGNANSLAALRGLARLAETRSNTAEALDYWTRYTEKTRPGDAAWYRGHYQQARLTLAGGDKGGSCHMLKALRPAMPGLGDANLRVQLGELYSRACE